ncbi:MAG: phosphatidate cytidylyltransferase [Actinobacteria bacterium]|nr:phosphatidate cytidylyltransferase [Actinomycetota bacterium]
MSDLHAINEAINKRAGRKLFTSLFIALILLAIIFTSMALLPVAFALVVALAFAISIHELVVAYRGSGIYPSGPLLIISGLSLYLIAWWRGDKGLFVALPVVAIINLIWLLKKGPSEYASRASASILTLLYLGLLPSFIFLLARDSDGFALISILVILVGVNDTFAYIAGVLLGKHKMAPRLSPKKSWEGFFGGLVATVIASSAAFHYLLERSWWIGALMGLVGVIAATFGDLIESALKRDFGIKDMSSFLPGHGGMLDRLDSATFTAPALWIFLELTRTLV